MGQYGPKWANISLIWPKVYPTWAQHRPNSALHSPKAWPQHHSHNQNHWPRPAVRRKPLNSLSLSGRSWSGRLTLPLFSDGGIPAFVVVRAVGLHPLPKEAGFMCIVRSTSKETSSPFLTYASPSPACSWLSFPSPSLASQKRYLLGI